MVSDKRTSSNSLTRWFRNKKLRTKIFVIVGIAIVMFASTLAFTLVRMNNEINNLENLIATDLVIEEIALELDVSGDEMIIAIQEHILLPEEGGALTHYAHAKNAFANETERMTEVLARVDAAERANIEPHIIELEHEIQEVIDLAEADDGIFWVIEQEISEDDEFEHHVEEISEEVQEFEHLTEDFTNNGDIADLVIEFQTSLWITAATVFMYELDHSEEEKQHVEYALAINNSTDGFSAHVTENRQIHTILADIKTEVSTNTTLVEDLSHTEEDLMIIKAEAKNLLYIAGLLEEDIRLLEEHTTHLEHEAEEISDVVEEHITEEEHRIETERDQTIMEVLLITAAVVIVSIVATFWISSLTVRPVKELADVSKQMSEGDLRQQITSEASKDEVGELQQYFTIMTDQLRNVISSTHESVAILTTTSEDLLSGSEEINASAEEVASTSQAMSNGATSQTELITDIN